MANRSYLYNLDFNRLERSKTEEDKVLGVSEYAYAIPLAYKILVSSSPVNSFSILWDYEHPISIFGDAKKGLERLLNFLKELQVKKYFEPTYLEEQIQKTTDFFSENNYDLKYFFLESGEIYNMIEEPVEEQNLSIFKEVQSIEKTISEFYNTVKLYNQEIEVLIEKKEEMTKKSWFKKSQYVHSEDERGQLDNRINSKIYEKRALLGIDNWSKVLYFHFG